MGAKKDDERILVAMRTDQSEYHVAGTKDGFVCSKCSCAISLAPAGQKFVLTNPDVPTVCLECAMKEKPDSIEPAPGALEELVEDAVRGTRHHRLN